LSAMETAGKEDMPEDAERKGLGTPATRAGILEKLVSAGFLERKKSRKTVQLLPSHDAVSLITVLPEQLQSPLLTAEWEYRLGEIERGQLAPEEFLDGISTMLKDLVGTYQVIKGTEYLFTPPREVVGKCPRCGGEVAELQKGFFCQNDSCKFAIWKNNKWWAAKKKQPTKAVVSALLNDGRVRVTGLYSEKTGKTYDAAVVLEDDGQYANFKLEFDQRKKLSLVERETILLYNQAEPMAEIYTHDPRLMEKLDLLAKKHPDQITRKDAHNFTVPKRCVSVREPYSAERRKAASERAKAAGYQPPMRKSDS